MSFDAVSYIIGHDAGKNIVEITGAIECADDGEGNITITEEENNG